MRDFVIFGLGMLAGMTLIIILALTRDVKDSWEGEDDNKNN